MARANQSPSALACGGLFVGMLLLGFAGTLLVMSPSLTGFEKEVMSVVRRLDVQTVPEQTDLAAPPAQVIDPATGQIVTYNKQGGNSFDESSGPGGSSESSAGGQRIGGTENQYEGGYGGDYAGDNLYWWLFYGGAGTGQILLSLAFAVCYYHNAVAPVIMTKGTLAMRGFHMTGKDDFDNGICGCFDDKWVLIHGCCCPLVRMAHTNAVSGVAGYWQSVAAWVCCSCLTGGIGPCCLMVYWRKQLKDIFGLEDHVINDLCITCFCPILSIIQQGIATDHASGYEVTGCCTLEWSGHYQG